MLMISFASFCTLESVLPVFTSLPRPNMLISPLISFVTCESLHSSSFGLSVRPVVLSS